MDALEKQVHALNTKVDTLQQVTENLGHRISEVLTEMKLSAKQQSHYGSELTFKRQTYSGYSSLDSSMEHKDVLIDASYPSDEQTSEQQLAPEIQIRRLTAQLTAAYNRIAALEEQLLAQRVH